MSNNQFTEELKSEVVKLSKERQYSTDEVLARDISTLLQMRPSIHLLCSGVFLQAPLQLSTNESYVPLNPLGFETPTKWLAVYTQQCGAYVDQSSIDALIQQGVSALPCTSIIHPISKWISPEEAERSSSQRLGSLRDLISWATGSNVQPFGIVILGPKPNEAYFRIITPPSSSRTRLGFGNTGADFVSSLTKIIEFAEKNEQFSFALSMLHDANAERNIRFKIARYFSCLEALAYRIKKGQGSRDAVRQLLGLSKGKTGQATISGRTYDYDVVLGAGILRNLLYHGVTVDFSKVKPNEKDTFDLLQNHPGVYASDLQSLVEIEIARWAITYRKGKFKIKCNLNWKSYKSTVITNITL